MGEAADRAGKSAVVGTGVPAGLVVIDLCRRQPLVERLRPGLFDAERHGIGQKLFEMLRRHLRCAGHVHPVLFGERQILAQAVDAIHHLGAQSGRRAHDEEGEDVGDDNPAEPDDDGEFAVGQQFLEHQRED